MTDTNLSSCQNRKINSISKQHERRPRRHIPLSFASKQIYEISAHFLTTEFCLNCRGRQANLVSSIWNIRCAAAQCSLFRSKWLKVLESLQAFCARRKLQEILKPPLTTNKQVIRLKMSQSGVILKRVWVQANDRKQELWVSGLDKFSPSKLPAVRDQIREKVSRSESTNVLGVQFLSF